MEILDRYSRSRPGKNQDFYEDRIVINDNFVVVMDGVSDREKDRLKPSGLWAVDTLEEAIGCLPAAVEADAAIMQISAELAAARELSEYANDRYLPGATVLIFSAHRYETWRVGDCSLMIDGYEYPAKKAYDQVMSSARAMLVTMLLEEGQTEQELLKEDFAWDLLAPWLERQHLIANTNHRFAYGVINGTPVPKHLIEVNQVRPKQELVFASNGYPKVLSNLAVTEAYYKEARRLDPLSIGAHPDWSPAGDDRTYLRFKI